MKRFFCSLSNQVAASPSMASNNLSKHHFAKNPKLVGKKLLFPEVL